jgi:hypothetical protein
MADVTGSIGNEYVELNNAATEATLKQLLAAVQRQGGTTAAGKTATAAGGAGVSEASIAAAKASAKNLQELAEKGEKLKQTYVALAAGVTELTGKLLQGTSNSSDLFSAFEKLPGAAGLVAGMFAKVARFQEENLGAYQKITDAGVSFGGSLTDMRTAAASTYMTLDQFTGLMKRNSETFAKLGGTVDQGARAFTGLSNSLLKSDAGDNLRALGLTSEQVNEGLAGYLAVTGGRNRQEMQNTAAITKGAGEYLTQLDALAAITGKSREEQEKQLKEASANAAYEAYLQTLDEEGKKKATLAMQNALATGGKAGADVLKSQLLGLPPMTEAAQKLTALGPNVANGIKQMGDAVNDTSKSMQDVEKGRAAAQAGASKDVANLGKSTLAAMSFMSGADAQTAMALQKQDNLNKQQGIKTQADSERQMKEVVEEQKKRQESEAKAAVESQKAMQELGQSILSILMPAIKLLTAVINPLAKFVSAVMTQFEKLNGIVQTIIVTGLALLAFQKLKQARQAAGQIPGGGGLADKLGGLKGGAGSVASNAGGMGSKLAGGLKGGIGGIVGGLALGAASDYAKEKGMEKTGAGLDIASQAASFAGTGAMLGSVVPGLGTAAGAVLGGVAGAGYGLYQNWGKMFGESGQKKAADGLMVNTPTNILAGEAGPEIVAPTKHFENLQNELQTLNKQTAEVIRYMKETAEYSRRSNDSIKNLGGDLFKF